MHVLFVHQNFPAQFGHIAAHLVHQHQMRCTFVSQKPPEIVVGIERIQYSVEGGASVHNHYCTRTFENAVRHTHAVYESLKQRPDIRPDLVVAHSGFGSSLFLSELYDCPVINYFEYFYRTRNSDMDFRPEFRGSEMSRLRARARNAMLLLDLENCQAGYSPTRWQHSQLPAEFRSKVQVIFDGIDTGHWRPYENVPRKIGSLVIPEGTRICTYVSRGFESIRGFDLFMQVAKQVCDSRDDVLFFVVGEDRICYGGDEQAIGMPSFKQWVLQQDSYDLERIRFLGRVTPSDLARLFSLSDLHLYWTVPFVLSWSLMNALSCGALVLASDTAPVREMIRDGENGLLSDFFDVDAFTARVHEVLDNPGDYSDVRKRARELIHEQYSMHVTLPQMLALYEQCVNS